MLLVRSTKERKQENFRLFGELSDAPCLMPLLDCPVHPRFQIPTALHCRPQTLPLKPAGLLRSCTQTEVPVGQLSDQQQDTHWPSPRMSPLVPELTFPAQYEHE